MSEIQELTDADFQKTVDESELPVLINFSATWCTPCKALAPIVETVAKEFEGRLLVRKVDIDKAQETASRLGIRGVPTCLLFKNKELVETLIGITGLKEFKSKVEKVLAS